MIAPFRLFKKNFMKPTLLPILSCLALAATVLPSRAQEADGAKYRFQKEGIALESAGNHGLSTKDVMPAKPLVFPRPRPMPHFSQTGRQPEKSGSIDKRRIEARLTAAGEAEAGFPLPQGGVFDPRRIRVLDATGAEIRAQVSATAYWPDDSIKWALLQFSAAQDTGFAVEFGNAVSRRNADSPLGLSREGDRITIRTGAIRATIDAKKFNLLADVTGADGTRRFGASAAEGVRLVSADGKVYSMSALPPSAFDIEEQGPEKIVLRVEGAYADAGGHKFMRYVTRLTFRANSARVTVSHRHINDVLEHEFTDFQSLDLGLVPAAKTGVGRLLLPSGEELSGSGKLGVFQQDENQSQVSGGEKTEQSGRSPGAFAVATEAGRIAVASEDFWQRWPKALGYDQGRITVGLLPKQPGEAYGNELPGQLIYPFVNGNYRMKWGMSFTERVTFDFGGSASLPQLAAAVNEAPLAILPSGWYEETGALGLMAGQHGNEFAEWDDFFDRAFQSYLQRREKNREYGFMNYGDWFGERGVNWGNNEYDTAHAFFMQFARAGKPEYYRAALAAARHQADVDIVHAYPDPRYIGANPKHSVGHTGVMGGSDKKGATWSKKYDGEVSAGNGHTWSEGMTEAWFLAGEPTVMESALMLGEHITWAVAPKFKIAVTAPRTAGWSLRAIVGLYRATGDAAYLKAADAIARAAIDSQDPTGIWVRDYSTSPPGTGLNVGNQTEGERGVSNFQLGLTLAGLCQYYDVTKDPAAKAAVLRGARLLAKAWPGSGGWPYDIRLDGTPSSVRPWQHLLSNILNAESVAYMGLAENDPELLRVTEEAVRNTLFYQEPVAARQQIGITLRSGQAVLGALHAAYVKNGTQWPGLAVDTNPEAFFKGIHEARKFYVRGPGTQSFLLKTKGAAATLRLFRADSNALHSGELAGKIRLRKPDGPTLEEQTVIFAGKTQEFSVKLPAEKDGVFLLEIEEPGRGIWNLDPEPLAGILMKADADFLLSAVTIARYAIAIPQGTESFTVSLTGTHQGAYGAALLDEQGRVLALYKNANIEGDRLGKDMSPPKSVGDNSATGKWEVTLRPEDAGKVLPLVLWAGGDLKVEIQGIPAWIARNSAECFTP